MRAPFPFFGGKRDIADVVWSRLGRPKQYIEPFFGSGAVLLSAPQVASLEVVNDLNGFLANFWRCVKYQPAETARWADYPVSHIDLGAIHGWIMAQRQRLAESLQDPDWPGDPKVGGRWLYGQCCWIGSGWAEWNGQIPHAGDAGRGVQAVGQIPHASDAGRGVQAVGKIPHAGDAGRGVQAVGQIPHAGDAGRGDVIVEASGQIPAHHIGGVQSPVRRLDHGEGMLTSAGRAAWKWLHELAERFERVRITHGEWFRCLNNHYGGSETAIFLDPPYRAYEALYGSKSESVADAVEAWARDNADLRVALCGHEGDYKLDGWDCVAWSRKRLTYSGNATTDAERIWFSPACLVSQPGLFDALDKQASAEEGEAK